MGYYTHYTLTARDLSSDDFDSLKVYLENEFPWFCSPHASCEDIIWEAGEDVKWYNHDDDMLLISKQHPEATFLLEGQGEEPEDMWRTYYKDGRVEEVRAQIYFPCPTNIEWN